MLLASKDIFQLIDQITTSVLIWHLLFINKKKLAAIIAAFSRPYTYFFNINISYIRFKVTLVDHSENHDIFRFMLHTATEIINAPFFMGKKIFIVSKQKNRQKKLTITLSIISSGCITSITSTRSTPGAPLCVGAGVAVTRTHWTYGKQANGRLLYNSTYM